MSEAVSHGGPEKKAEADSALEPTRRGLLKGLFAFVGVLGLGCLTYGGYRFLAPGAGASVSAEMPLDEVPVGAAYPFQYGTAPGLLFRGEDGSMKAFSLVCTHLACTVNWNPEKRTFHCPCHDGLFDEDGKVISGPPPTPLEQLKVEVKGDKIVVGAV